MKRAVSPDYSEHIYPSVPAAFLQRGGGNYLPRGMLG